MVGGRDDMCRTVRDLKKYFARMSDLRRGGWRPTMFAEFFGLILVCLFGDHDAPISERMTELNTLLAATNDC